MSDTDRFRPLPDIPGRDPVAEGEEELRFHLEMRTREYMERGMTEEEALAAAEARLGDMDALRRDLGIAMERERRVAARRSRISGVLQDLRYAVRTLVRAPSFTGISVSTLALGIGATTAIFSLVWAVLLAPLPYPESDRLVRIWETSPQGAERNVASSGNVTDWRERARSFAVLGAHRGLYSVPLTGRGPATPVALAELEPEVVRALRMEAVEGRLLLPEDGAAGNVAVISEDRWRGVHGADPDIVGTRVTLDARPFTIVGVMPDEMGIPSDQVDFWLPVADAEMNPSERTSHNFMVLARLAPGVTVEAAQHEMDAITARIAEENPASMTGWGVNVVELQTDITRNVAPLFRVLLGGVVVVLLIACVNLANLLLARAVARRREMSVRGALGADRRRIVRQLLTESLVLATLGGIAAMLVAPVFLRALVGVAPVTIPNLDAAAIDLRMLGFAAVVTIGCAILFGLAPALRLSDADPSSAMRSGRGSSASGHVRLRGALLAGQVALSLVLLVAAGLFVRSFRAIQNVDPGFRPSGLAMVDLQLPLATYPDLGQQVSYWDRVMERAAALPGVTGTASTSHPPGGDNAMTFSFAIEGRTATNPSGREDDELLHAVSSDYFSVTGHRMIEGRAFDARDRTDGVPVVILNESLARKHFPEGDAIGRRIAFRVGETPWREIVGVVADARIDSPDQEPVPAIYIPFAQKSWDWLTWGSLMVRAAEGTDPASLAPALRTAVAEVDPNIPPESIRTVEQVFRQRTAARTFAMTLVGGFGALAVVLCVVGLYGLISYSVARERRDIGVRIALGAGSVSVVRRVVSRSLLIAAAGTLVGIPVAIGVSRSLTGLLYGVTATDPVTYLWAVTMILTVSLASSLIPAMRAARTDPSAALRID